MADLVQQIMQSGAGYQRVSHHELDGPAAHIAALGEFARVLRAASAPAAGPGPA
jgi:hypothetical protein